MERLEQRRRPVRRRHRAASAAASAASAAAVAAAAVRRVRRRPQRRRRRLWRVVGDSGITTRIESCKRWKLSDADGEVSDADDAKARRRCHADDTSHDGPGVLLAPWRWRCPAVRTTRSRARKRRIKTAQSEVQNQLQRRNDLIPNLVETVKGYASQEKEIFTAIAESRARLMDAKTPDEQIEAANAADQRARAPARGRRELPAAEVGRELPAADGRARRHREPHRRGASALQRDGAASTTRCAAASRRTSPPRCSASRSTRTSRRRPRRRSCRRSTSASKRATTSSRRLTYNSGARTRSLRAPRESARTFSVPRGSRAGCGGIQPPLHSITSGVARLTAAASHTDAAEVDGRSSVGILANVRARLVIWPGLGLIAIGSGQATLARQPQPGAQRRTAAAAAGRAAARDQRVGRPDAQALRLALDRPGGDGRTHRRHRRRRSQPVGHLRRLRDRRHLEDRQQRHDLDAALRRAAGLVDRRRRDRRRRIPTSSMSAPASPTTARARRSATASTSPPTPARPSSTSG